ncbi:SRPBCC family protein [Vallicoccus soli]|uniref:SRPBCC family protein n=1 Tax=Vallicoccus soli TaxID=2339232 RepID=A0A3A3YX16_9ACTN|nr:SRPBCC family protein [Vallicoccus soli]RJK96117.1 SRPBCC family protein [Vallicoccus soli]
MGRRTGLDGDGLARTLGWASLGLGVPLVAAPGATLRAAGLVDGAQERAAALGVGVRELAAAAALLARPRPAWLWARVAGDAVDLALVGRSLEARPDPRGRATAAALAGIAAVDLYAALTRSRRGSGVHLHATTTVRTGPRAAYDAWRLEDLPRFMAHLEEVRVTGPRTSRWTATAPFGRTVSWDAETTEDVPGERLSWRSTGGRVGTRGTVRFVPAPGDRGTEVHVDMTYEVPAGALGRAVARWAGEEPHQQLDDDLRRYKQVVETGEVVRSEGAPGGKRARHEFPQHPAQPLSAHELEEVRA